MSNQRRFTWRSGSLPGTPITDFFQIAITVQDPSVPNLPLETPYVAPPVGGSLYTLTLMGVGM